MRRFGVRLPTVTQNLKKRDAVKSVFFCLFTITPITKSSFGDPRIWWCLLNLLQSSKQPLLIRKSFAIAERILNPLMWTQRLCTVPYIVQFEPWVSAHPGLCVVFISHTQTKIGLHPNNKTHRTNCFVWMVDVLWSLRHSNGTSTKWQNTSTLIRMIVLHFTSHSE